MPDGQEEDGFEVCEPQRLVRRETSVDFALGGIALGQTSNIITTMLENLDDDLLVIGYAYFNASTLDSLRIGEWLKAKQGRHLMLILGVHGQAPLWKLVKPWSKEAGEFGRLVRMWKSKGVPLSQIQVYAVGHWHVKIAATLRHWADQPRPNYTGVPQTDQEQMLTYDATNFVSGYVTEAVIGSTNATYFAMNKEGNFEFDVHILRQFKDSDPTSRDFVYSPELGQLNSKIYSLLKHMAKEVNNMASVSAKATLAMRAVLDKALI